LSNHGLGPGEGPVQNNGRYFQVPDLVFDLKLTANEKLVLIYFMRRADRAGRSFPSIERICRDCGFKAQNTVRRAVKGLEAQGLLRVERKASRSNRFYVAGWLYEVIGKAKTRHEESGIASPAARNDDTDGPTNSLSLRRSALSRRSPGEAGSDCGNLMKNSDDFDSPNFAATDTAVMLNKTTPTPSKYEAPLQIMKPRPFII
jgi:hypothetical protein